MRTIKAKIRIRDLNLNILLTIIKTTYIVISIIIVLANGKNMLSLNKEERVFWAIWLSLIIVCMVLEMLGYLKLSDNYHLFADSRSIYGIKNALNVISNVSFLIVGGIICYQYHKNNTQEISLLITLLGSMLVFLGSGYYHENPNDYRLLFDRLPMALVFAGIISYSIIKLELITFIKKKFLFSLYYVLFSIVCVLVWFIGSLYGNSILGPYVFLQFGGMLLLIVMAFLAKKKNELNLMNKIISIIFVYVIAKLFENYDSEIYSVTNNLISGHTLKHIASSYALYIWLKINPSSWG